MDALIDRVVCITGASRGLGASLARAFHRRDAKLVLGSRDASRLAAVARECGNAEAVVCDVRRADDVERLVRTAVDRFERLDVMINNAAVAVYAPFLETREADLDVMLATNVKGTYLGCQAALRVMKEQGDGLIVNISSISGARHLINESAYGASKWAVQGLTGVLHQEAAKLGVRVTSVVAGGIATPFWKDRAFVPFPRSAIDPAKDFMSPDEVAELVVDIARRSDRFVVPEVVCLPLLP